MSYVPKPRPPRSNLPKPHVKQPNWNKGPRNQRPRRKSDADYMGEVILWIIFFALFFYFLMGSA